MTRGGAVCEFSPAEIPSRASQENGKCRLAVNGIENELQQYRIKLNILDISRRGRELGSALQGCLALVSNAGAVQSPKSRFWVLTPHLIMSSCFEVSKSMRINVYFRSQHFKTHSKHLKKMLQGERDSPVTF